LIRSAHRHFLADIVFTLTFNGSSLDASFVSSTEVTAIGLSVSRSIMESHEGHLWQRSVGVIGEVRLGAFGARTSALQSSIERPCFEELK
jgi:hypothetical protein